MHHIGHGVVLGGPKRRWNGAAENERRLLLGKFVGRTFFPDDFRHESLIRPSQFEDGPIRAEDQFVIEIARKEVS